MSARHCGNCGSEDDVGDEGMMLPVEVVGALGAGAEKVEGSWWACPRCTIFERRRS